jgi:hypothetical protein
MADGMFSILLNVFVPISLWVTLELVKFGQGRFMQWDREMYDDSPPEEWELKGLRHRGMVAKTTNLNEDLGRVRVPAPLPLCLFQSHVVVQVQHIFRYRVCLFISPVLLDGSYL